MGPYSDEECFNCNVGQMQRHPLKPDQGSCTYCGFPIAENRLLHENLLKRERSRLANQEYLASATATSAERESAEMLVSPDEKVQPTVSSAPGDVFPGRSAVVAPAAPAVVAVVSAPEEGVTVATVEPPPEPPQDPPEKDKSKKHKSR